MSTSAMKGGVEFRINANCICWSGENDDAWLQYGSRLDLDDCRPGSGWLSHCGVG